MGSSGKALVVYSYLKSRHLADREFSDRVQTQLRGYNPEGNSQPDHKTSAVPSSYLLTAPNSREVMTGGPPSPQQPARPLLPIQSPQATTFLHPRAEGQKTLFPLRQEQRYLLSSLTRLPAPTLPTCPSSPTTQLS